MREVEMITSFNLEGLPRPHRFRLEAEDDTLAVVKIDKILFAEENKREGIIKYRCKCTIVDFNLIRELDIYYRKKEVRWYVDI